MAAVGTKRTPARQSGAALLILLALIIPVLLYAVVAGLSRSSGEIARARDLKTYAALAQAKEALITYAVTYMDTHANQVPGYLPCPDLGPASIVDEGVTAPICGSSLEISMGRLPWRTLGLDALKDGSGECLWYAVSGTYKNNPNGVSGSDTTSNMMNWDTNGQFKVFDSDGSTLLAGSTEDTQPVAVVFAPGKALSGQDRTPASGTGNCGGNYTAAAYLDSVTVNSVAFNNSTLVTPSSPALVTDVSSFIAGTGSDSFNDKLVYITRADIWNAIKKRSDFKNYLRALTRRAAECTAMYGYQNSSGTDRRLPWPDKPSLSATSVPRYAVNKRYDDDRDELAGRLPFKVKDSRADTGNNISDNISDWGSNDAYIFTPASPTPGSYCNYTADQKIWYENWKDHLFYAIADSFKPSVSWQWWYPLCCGTYLKMNGSGSYAAVVIFAGEKLSGQSRSTATDKGLIANYLEGRNSSNYPNSGGNGNYQAAAAGATFNDIVYAMDKTDLAVQCSDDNGTMQPAPAAAVAPPGNATAVKNYAACP